MFLVHHSHFFHGERKMEKIDLDEMFRAELTNIEQDNDKLKVVFKVTANMPLAVSYTHLTLPTIYSV